MKSICKICKEVYSTTSKEPVWILTQDDIEELDSKWGEIRFDAIVFSHLREKTKRAYICDECLESL